MSEEEQKYFKGLIDFTFDSDDIRYIEKIVDKKDKEIERLKSIIKEVREYFKNHTLKYDDLMLIKPSDVLEILDKEGK